MSKDLAVQEAASLPALYGDIHDEGDLQLSGIYVIAELSQMAKDRVAAPGDVVLALGSDDASPTHLIKQEDDPKGTFDAYVIARDSFVASTAGGQMTFLPKDYVRSPDERDVWNGYFYYIAIPDIDPAMPARMMLWRTAGMPVAKKINTFLLRSKAMNDTRPVHVRFGVTKRTGRRSGQPYWALTVSPIPPGDDLDVALRQQAMYLESQARFNVTEVAPDTDAAAY